MKEQNGEFIHTERKLVGDEMKKMEVTWECRLVMEKEDDEHLILEAISEIRRENSYIVRTDGEIQVKAIDFPTPEKRTEFLRIYNAKDPSHLERMHAELMSEHQRVIEALDSFSRSLISTEPKLNNSDSKSTSLPAAPTSNNIATSSSASSNTTTRRSTLLERLSITNRRSTLLAEEKSIPALEWSHCLRAEKNIFSPRFKIVLADNNHSNQVDAIINFLEKNKKITHKEKEIWFCDEEDLFSFYYCWENISLRQLKSGSQGSGELKNQKNIFWQRMSSAEKDKYFLDRKAIKIDFNPVTKLEVHMTASPIVEFTSLQQYVLPKESKYAHSFKVNEKLALALNTPDAQKLLQAESIDYNFDYQTKTVKINNRDDEKIITDAIKLSLNDQSKTTERRVVTSNKHQLTEEQVEVIQSGKMQAYYQSIVRKTFKLNNKKIFVYDGKNIVIENMKYAEQIFADFDQIIAAKKAEKEMFLSVDAGKDKLDELSVPISPKYFDAKTKKLDPNIFSFIAERVEDKNIFAIDFDRKCLRVKCFEDAERVKAAYEEYKDPKRLEVERCMSAKSPNRCRPFSPSESLPLTTPNARVRERPGSTSVEFWNKPSMGESNPVQKITSTPPHLQCR